eukprot:10379070-Lingulodinium_polyedra.AAC.1
MHKTRTSTQSVSKHSAANEGACAHGTSIRKRARESSVREGGAVVSTRAPEHALCFTKARSASATS